MEFFEQLWQTVATATVAALALGFAGRKAVEYFVDRRLIETRAELDTQREAFIARLRAELDALDLEHRVRFEKLHERQVEVVAEVYGNLERLHMSIRAPAFGVSDYSDERKAEIVELSDQFVDHYYPNAIWLSRGLCDQMNEVLESLQKLNWYGQRALHDRSLYEEVAKLHHELGELREPVEEEFRRILGVVREESPVLAAAGD